jgi:pilus assembly protein Flp/PilA
MINKAAIRLLNEIHDLRDAVIAHERDRGATAVEYALIVSLIAIAIVGLVATLGGTIGEIFDNANTEITERQGPGAAG